MSRKIRVVKGSLVSTSTTLRAFISKFQVAQPALRKLYFEGKNALQFYIVIVVMVAALLLAGCRKEQLTGPALNSLANNKSLAAASANTAPTVDAGPVRRVVVSATERSKSVLSSSATLYGRTWDNEGPVTVQWTQTCGNSVAVIEQPNSDTTNVSGLQPGIYTFVLTVTDITGTSRKDSTSVTILQKMTWNIEGVTREALVHVPTSCVGTPPIIFAFHGHGGTDLGFSERAFEVNWPEAIVVYPQGLATKSGADKAGKEAGWQATVGEVNSATGVQDQDLKFFDAMMVTFKNRFKVNNSQVFAHGWSNGGMFVYNVLWSARGDKLTALAPAAAVLSTTSGKKPLPIIHVAGTSDHSVRFSSQQQTVQSDRTLDQCASTGTTWATGPNKMLGTEYTSCINAPVVSLQYDGGHAYPFTIPPYIVKFFKEVAAGL